MCDSVALVERIYSQLNLFQSELRQRLVTSLGTPNVVQIYLTFLRYCVTGDLSRKRIIRLFFTFGFG